MTLTPSSFRLTHFRQVKMVPSMRYQLDSIGEIQPGSRALSPRKSNITYGKIGFFQSSDVCDVVAAMGPIYMQVNWYM